MVTVIFRSRLREAGGGEYEELAARMLALAESMPGFVAFRSYAAEDGERIAISSFDTLQAAEAWRDHPEHLEAQRLGRERFYSEFHIQVSEEIRSYSFEAPA